MITEEQIKVFAKDFEYLFKRDVELPRLQALLEFWGEEKVRDAMNYLLINGLPQLNGKKDNPYGLIYSMCRINFEH